MYNSFRHVADLSFSGRLVIEFVDKSKTSMDGSSENESGNDRSPFSQKFTFCRLVRAPNVWGRSTRSLTLASRKARLTKEPKLSGNESNLFSAMFKYRRLTRAPKSSGSFWSPLPSRLSFVNDLSSQIEDGNSSILFSIRQTSLRQLRLPICGDTYSISLPTAVRVSRFFSSPIFSGISIRRLWSKFKWEVSASTSGHNSIFWDDNLVTVITVLQNRYTLYCD